MNSTPDELLEKYIAEYRRVNGKDIPGGMSYNRGWYHIGHGPLNAFRRREVEIMLERLRGRPDYGENAEYE